MTLLSRHSMLESTVLKVQVNGNGSPQSQGEHKSVTFNPPQNRRNSDIDQACNMS